MNEKALKTITDRMKYLDIIDSDLKRLDEQRNVLENQISQLQQTINAIQMLSVQPEKEAMIQIGKRVFVTGNLKHTGEYMITLPAGDTEYRKLCTVNQSVHHLELKLKGLEETVKLLKAQKEQVTKRAEQLTGVSSTIESDKGVAVKVGEFYEIIEYED